MSDQAIDDARDDFASGYCKPRSEEVDGRQSRHSYVLPTQTLSAREGEICKLLVEGHSLRQIAMRLSISVHTANTHARNAYAKLHVHNRVALIHRFHARSAHAGRMHTIDSARRGSALSAILLKAGKLQANA